MRPDAMVFSSRPDPIIERYGLNYAPAIWLIDGNGILQYKQLGDAKPPYTGQLNNPWHADVIISELESGKADPGVLKAASSPIDT